MGGDFFTVHQGPQDQHHDGPDAQAPPIIPLLDPTPDNEDAPTGEAAAQESQHHEDQRSAIDAILDDTKSTRSTATQMRDDLRARNDRGQEEPQGRQHDRPNVPAPPILPLSSLTPENADAPAVDAGVEALAQPPGAAPVGTASAGAALQTDEHHTTSHIPTTEDTTTPTGELRARARRLAARAGAQLNGVYDGIRDGRLVYGSVAPHEVDNFNLMIDWTMWYIMCSKDDVVNDDVIVQRVINWYLTRRWSQRLREDAAEQPPPQTGGQTTTPAPPAHEPPQLEAIHDASTQTEGTSTTSTSEVATSTSWPCTQRWQRWGDGWRSADGRWISCWTCANGGHKGGWGDKCPKPPPDDEVLETPGIPMHDAATMAKLKGATGASDEERKREAGGGWADDMRIVAGREETEDAREIDTHSPVTIRMALVVCYIMAVRVRTTGVASISRSYDAEDHHGASETRTHEHDTTTRRAVRQHTISGVDDADTQRQAAVKNAQEPRRRSSHTTQRGR